MNAIPEITDALGRCWKQPKRDSILLDDKVAVMSQESFDELLEYNTSYPSGVYEGKMWKRKVMIELGFDRALTPSYPIIWYLCWFGHSDTPGKVSVNTREIIIS